MSSPLEDIRVLDLTRLLPGGYCTLLLADLGADVLKVEDTAAGDYLRWAPPQYESDEPSSASALFQALNRGKRSIRLNLKEQQGREIFLRLVCEHDVLVESFRPGVMERLGVGYEVLKAENPKLIYCAITGYGQDGPLRDRVGHDMNYLALAGLLGMTGERDGPPIQAATQISDLAGGALMAAVGILAALHKRERTGKGQLVDISMADGALSLLAIDAARYFCDGVVPQRGELPLAGGAICYRPYRCKDGYVAFGALEQKFWQNFCHGIGREDLIDRQFDPLGSQTHVELETAFAERTRSQWERFANEHECCLEPVLDLDEALASELFAARGMITEVEQPGIGPVKQVASPIKLAGCEPSSSAAPMIGQNTEEILRLLGYNDQEIVAMQQSGVVADHAQVADNAFLT